MIRRTNRTWVVLVVLLAVFALVGNGSNAQAQPSLPPLDIVFIIDESGSMGDDINQVKARVNEIATQLEASTDPRYALVGFGEYTSHTGSPYGQPHTHTNFTNKAGFSSALTGLIAYGGNEPGVWSTIYAMNSITGYRQGAGVCAVLITDEDSDTPNNLNAAKIALDARSAVWFGIVRLGYGNTNAYYGPNTGSLSAHTGGAVFNIFNFRTNAGPVLSALLEECVIAITQGVILTPGTDTNFTGERHIVTATVKDSLGNPIAGKLVTFNVTAGPNVGVTASRTTDANGEVTFNYTGYGGPGTDIIVASFVDDEGATITSRPVEKIWELPPETDLEIEASELLDPPTEIDVSVPVQVTLVKVVTNNGPATIVDALVTVTAVAPPGCDVTPLSESEPVLGLTIREHRMILEVFTIHCSEPSFHTFEFTNAIEVTTTGVTDPILANNQITTDLTVASIAYADVEIASWDVPSPSGYLSGLQGFADGDLLISEEVFISTTKTVANNGPWGPVDVDGMFSWTSPDVHVLGLRPWNVEDLTFNTPANVYEDFYIHCYKPGTYTIPFWNDITDVEPDDIHVVDPEPGNNSIARSLTIQCVIPVPVDINPQSCRNPLNVDKKGVLPISILGTDGFDVTQIDPASVRLEGVAPLRWELEDVSTPFEPYVGKADAFDCTEDGADGHMDLTLKFDAQEIVTALGDVSEGDVLVLHLSGELKQEFGAHYFYGEDVIVILKKGK